MNLSPQEVKIFYQKAFRFFDKRVNVTELNLEFYPYVNVNNQIKARDGVISVRISNLLKDAPLEIHNALAFILVAKLLGKKIPPEARKIYRQYLNDESFQDKAIEHKRKNGRKILTTPKGKYFDLEKIFHKLNLVYFQNEIPKPKLSWSRNKTFRRLGHHDPVHDAIIISRSLDEKDVPKFVVEYVVFHEMLHIKHPVTFENGKRRVHTPEFRRDEEKFSFFEEAEEWIEKNALRIKRKVKNQK
jgi:predicted metal-dependent hydrolase